MDNIKSLDICECSKGFQPNTQDAKGRPVLIIGNDECNDTKHIDVQYLMITSSGPLGKYDVEIPEDMAKEIGLTRASVIKSTKVYTSGKSFMLRKYGDLPKEKKEEFIKKYSEFQNDLINNMKIEE